MDDVKIYNGQTEEEMFQEIEDVKKAYSNGLIQYKIQ